MKLSWWSWLFPRTRSSDIESTPLRSGVNVKDRLIRAMAHLEDNASVSDLQKASGPYFKFLEATFDRISAEVLRVTHTPSLNDLSSEDQKQRLYEIVEVIVDTLRNEKEHMFLGKLCRELERRTFIQAAPTSHGTPNPGLENYIRASQLIFILFGTLTMLYTPRTEPSTGKLQMRQMSGLDLQRRSTTTWHIDSQDFSTFGEDISFDDLLSQYSRSHYGPVPRPSVQDPTHEPNLLRSEDLSFYTLAQLLSVRISWTTSICEHLEFNPRSKQLKIFRFPSYCVLLCLLEPNKTYLDSLFRKLLENDEIESADYFREVLSTYRLIFGQHKDARTLIKTFCSQGRIFGIKNPFKDEHVSALLKETPDPLLEELCFKDSRHVPVFAELEMVDLKNIYNLDSDFPYFSERLKILQSFVQNQCPQDWQVLWRDRRDVAKFWTIWAVMLFGIPTLILSVIQTVLTGLQLRD
ncbi:hypothetical protein Neosp_014143 [[Neocosmospora] mangrovei]